MAGFDNNQISFQRGARMLRTALGPAIGRFLEDPAIVEVMLNPDGRVWIDRLLEGLADTGERLSAADGERIVRLVAHHVGAEVHARASNQATILRKAVANRANILVAGGTSTGKTTLTNALLAEVSKGTDRVITIEDTRELQCTADNKVPMRSVDAVIDLLRLSRATMRFRPDRIIVGEVRGPEALGLLKLWGTGHPGGIGTLHAGSALGALHRLEQLIQEAVITVPRSLIGEAIDLIAVLAGRGSSRRLTELARVDGLGPDGAYRIFPATNPEGDSQ